VHRLETLRTDALVLWRMLARELAAVDDVERAATDTSIATANVDYSAPMSAQDASEGSLS
jgi:hypothetical protein